MERILKILRSRFFLAAFCILLEFGQLMAVFILLAVMRFLLLHHVSRTGIGVDAVSEFRRYRLCGII